ncbi:MAG: YfhO family protein [Candidatus Levybacteria bacterium]|nr:YfhO family protein [Candidatus Levybacteria bacterium]
MKNNIIAIILGLVLVVIFLWSNLFLPAVNITPSVGTNDFTDAYYPSLYYYSDIIKSGKLPLWSSLFSGGFPLFAGAGGMLYPLYLFSLLFPPAISSNFFLLTDYFLIFLFSFLYLRKIHLKTWASFFGAMLISFGGFSANQIIYPTILANFYFLIAELYILETFLQGGGRNFIWVLVMGLILGLTLLAGHPQYIFYGFLLIIPYWFIFWKKRPKWLFLLYLSIVLIIALSIGAAQYLPQTELTLASTRSAGLNTAAITRFNLPFSSLIGFISPFALVDPQVTMEAFSKNGWPVDSQYMYMGIIGLIFVMLALIKLFKLGKYAVFFAFAAIFSLLFSFGSQFPIVNYILTVPPFSFFRIPFKIIFVLNFSLGVLAAYSFNWFLNKLKKPNMPKWGVMIVLIMVFAISFFDLKINSEKLHPPVDANKWYKTPEVVSFIKDKLKDQERVTTQLYYYPSLKIFLEKHDLWNNPETYANLRNLLPAYNSFMYGIPLNVGNANGGGLKISRYNELEMEIVYGGIKYADDFNSAQVNDSFLFLNRLMGVRYAIFAQPVKNELLSRVFRTNFKNGQDQIYVYEFTDYFPRTFMVPKAEKAEPLEIKKHLIKGDFNPKDKIYVEEDTNWGAKGGFAATALFEKYTDQEVTINTQSSGDSFLFLSDNYYPGWIAEVDGKETKILRANYTFRAVPVSEGKHKVIFRYEPKSFYYGARITLISSALTILAILIVFIIQSIKKVYGKKEPVG